jgi:hypothetical protein
MFTGNLTSEDGRPDQSIWLALNQWGGLKDRLQGKIACLTKSAKPV